jgi:hypothetical protein
MADSVRRSGRKSSKRTDLSEEGSGPNSPSLNDMEVTLSRFFIFY